MPCTPAQLEANRRNSVRSTGPRTADGKAISRHNGIKHGLTGRGVVLLPEDAEEVDRRFAELSDDLRPSGGLERALVRRVALMTVRLDRSAEHETLAIAHRVRHALADFDDARMAEAEHMLAWIAHQPETNARRLRGSPEGLTLLLRALEGLRSELARPDGLRWDFGHCDRLHHLMGRRREDWPVSRARALTEAVHGRDQHLEAREAAGLGNEAKRAWAMGELLTLIDAEIADLKARLEGIDRGTLERDRLEAPGRAKFDPSKDAILARKYEGASERALYRALRELREARAETPRVEAPPEQAGEIVPEEEPTREAVAAVPVDELGSCSPGPSADPEAEAGADPTRPSDPSSDRRRRPDPDRLAWKARRKGKKAG